MKIEEIVKKQKQFYKTNQTKSVKYRKVALRKLKEAILKNEREIEIALKKDLNKSSSESYMAEIGMCLSEINYLLRKVNNWSKKKEFILHLLSFVLVAIN